MSQIHNWVSFLLWLHPFILSQVISPLLCSNILGTYRPGEFIFQCPIFLPFHTVHGEGNGNPSSTPAWKIPWIGEPGRLQSKGSQSWTQLSDFTFFLSIVPFAEGNANPLQCSCLENPMDRGAWWGCGLWGCRVGHN